jgi:hypothetical protein
MWALVDPNGNIRQEESYIGEDSQTKPGWRWLPVTDTPNPKYDSKTKTLDGPFFNITDDSIERFWNVRDKTTEELNAEKANAISSLSPALIDILLHMENRIRVLNNLDEFSKQDFLAQIKEII